MRRLFEAALILILLILAAARAAAPLPVFAAPLPEQTRKLLEKSLSVTEIDREIERIAALGRQTQEQIAVSEHKLARQEIEIAVQREKAGRVLRAYYTGQRDFVMAALLNAGSLPDLLRTWELMDLVVSSDHDALNKYTKQYTDLREGYNQLKADKTELSQVEQNLQSQRERVLALQREIDRALAGSGDEAHLRQLMAELQLYWNNVGLYEVNRHFRELTDAMKELPDWLRKHPETLETKGLKTKLTITDAQLNEFLRSRNADFKQFAIRFEKDRMMLEGDNGNMQIKIGGHYAIVNAPENGIVFHVDSLNFNGLDLPDTTRADLERQFDLGFYPQKLIKFIKAQSVAIEPGRLIVQLKVG